MDRILWGQDRDYIWHAGRPEWPKSRAFCGYVEASHGGSFYYPKYQLDLSDLCAKCNKESGANFK